MDKKKIFKAVAIGILVPTVLVVGYYGTKWAIGKFNKGDDDKGENDTSSDPIRKIASTVPKSPFKTKNEVHLFQLFTIFDMGDKTILGKGGSTGYGDDKIWGTKTAKAWEKYGSQYIKKGGKTAPNTTSPDFYTLASNLKIAMKGWGTDEDTIYSQLRALRNQSDWNTLSSQYAKLEPKLVGTLSEDIDDELNGFEKSKVNAILKERGISQKFV